MKRFFLLSLLAILLLGSCVGGFGLLEAKKTNTKESYLNEKIVQLADDMAFNKLLTGYFLLLDENSSLEEKKQGFAILEGVVAAMIEVGRTDEEIQSRMQDAATTVASWYLVEAHA